MKHWLFLFLILFTAWLNAQTGTASHRMFTQQDGIELTEIHTMAIDNDGFLWIGGESLSVRTIIYNEEPLMIQRFNGRTFHSIPLPDYDDRIVGVGQFYKRDDGKFYIRAQQESGEILLLFDPYSVSFTQIAIDNSDENHFGMSHIFSFQGQEYLITQLKTTITLNILQEDLKLQPVFSYSLELDRKFHVERSTKLIPFESHCMIGDDNFAIVALDWQGNLLKQYSEDSFKRDRGAFVNKFFIDEVIEVDGVYYAIMDRNSQLHVINEKDHTVTPIPDVVHKLPEGEMNTLMDPLGNHVIVSQNNTHISVEKFDGSQMQTLYFGRNLGSAAGFELISDDLTKDMWLGNNKGELHHLKFPATQIQTFLPNTAIRTINRLPNNNFLIATESNGWHELDLNTMTTLPLEVFEKGKPYFPSTSRNAFKSGNTLWSSSHSNILEVDWPRREIIAHRHYPVVAMEQPHDTLIVYATNGYNLMSFDTRTKIHTPLLKTDTLFIFDIEIQDGGPLVVGGTDKGMLTYDLHTGEHQFFNTTTQLEDPFTLMMDYHPDYGYLLGSRSGIITAYKPEDQSFTQVYKDALQAGIATLLFDDNKWWINTFNGIVAFDPENSSTQRFSEKDGLSHNEANRYSALDTGNGFLVGTISGLNYFKPEQLIESPSQAEIVLLRERNFNPLENQISDQLSRSFIDNTDRIDLPAEYKEFQVDFALTHALDNPDHSFRYRFQEGDWVDLGQEQSIRFPNLAPGNHELEIEALDFSGKKIGASLFLQIQSQNFFYKTPWFYLLVTLALSLLFFYLLKQARLRQSLQEQFASDLLLSQEEERTRIAKDLHDSVGQQLTLIKKKAQNVDQTEISALTHTALEEVRQISRGLYPAVLKQLGLTESIEQLVYDWDEESDIFFTSDIDDIDGLFSEKNTLNFYRFIQESLHNIIKHAQAGQVSLIIKKDVSTIQVRIEDDGVGFDPNDKLKLNSLGLKTLSERIRILNGTLQIQSKPGQGTLISTSIPIRT